MFTLALALLITDPAPTPEPVSGPIKMKMSEIRKYNESLPRDHPSYIRCIIETPTGTLAKQVRTCRTNADWDRASREGNSKARGIVESTQRGWSEGPPDPRP